ncbi:MAG: sulfatase/phosphatase domain-containing protein [Planctomycetota bacterium]|jgi:N-acetylglucosamine-6-sulfatase
MRVPMLAYCPDLFRPGTVVEGVVAGIDIGPTAMEAAGLNPAGYMDGASYLRLAAGKQGLKDWRDYLMYEYYWEFAYPHTPTTFALRGNRYKFIQYHGIWDTDELYDIAADPKETHNLIHSPEHQKLIGELRRRLHDILEEADGARVPFSFKRNHGSNLRKYSGSKAAEFPPEVMRSKDRYQ